MLRGRDLSEISSGTHSLEDMDGGKGKASGWLEPMWGWGKGGGGAWPQPGSITSREGPALPSSLEPGILFSCRDGAPLNQNT